MSLCPLINFKHPLPVLTNKTNTSHHPWERSIKSVYYDRIKHVHNSVRNPTYPKPKEDVQVERIKFTVIGIRTCKEFIHCANLVKGMHKYRSKTFDVPVIKGVLDVDWPSAWHSLKITYGGSAYCITTPVIILRDGEFFGGDQELKEFIESKYIYRICLDYRKEALEEFSRYVKSTGRPFVYMRISIDGNNIGTLIFMLYSDIVPNTCENFLRLCKTRRGGYSGSPVHRIVKGGWIQCGGFALRESSLGCENYAIPFNRRGVIAMCNDGREVNCSTQFFVLLQPSEWMDHKYVAFGQLVEGEETLMKIENVPTFYEAPTSSIIIDMAGLLNLDCKDITINKNARAYINKHIEDLIETKEFFIELLMQHVWAAIKAREREDLEKLQLLNQSLYSEPSQTRHPNSKMSLLSKHNEDKNKENQEFATESYIGEEEHRYDGIASSVNKSSSKASKPFYLPLTDVPYLGEVDSTFNLKKFLRGDYCLESDLQEHLHKDEKQREVLKIVYSNLPSDLLLFDEDEYIGMDNADVDSSEEEEIINYIKNNVDRVSFAGDVVKNIGTPRKGHAMFNLFEGKRKSELPFVTDEDLKRLRRVSVLERRQSRKQSEIPTFTDEDLRKLRRASAVERGTLNPYDRRQSLKKVSMAPVPFELPKLVTPDMMKQKKAEKSSFSEETIKRLRRASQAVRKPIVSEDELSLASKISDESIESEELPKIDPEMIPKMRHKSTFDKRRQSVFDPLKFRSDSPGEVQGLRKSQIEKLRRISMFDAENKDPGKSRASSVKESFDKKRRQTVFAKDIARFQSFQAEASEEGSGSNLNVAQQKTIRFPSGTQETHKEIKRRQTGYIHEEDLDKLNHELEEQYITFLRQTLAKKMKDEKVQVNIIEEGAITLAIPVKDEDPQVIERRQTRFVRPTPSLLGDIGDIPIVQNTSAATLPVAAGSNVSINPPSRDLSSKDQIREPRETNSFDDYIIMEEELKTFDKKTKRREHTSKPRKVSHEDELSKIEHLRESVFQRLYESSLLPDRSPPTLKNYKPMSEIIPNTKNMYLTVGKGIHFDLEKNRSPHLRTSKNIESDLSFITMSGIRFGRKISAMNDNKYETNITEQNSPFYMESLRIQNKYTKRPLITVKDYQRKNQERLEKLKEKEALNIETQRR